MLVHENREITASSDLHRNKKMSPRGLIFSYLKSFPAHRLQGLNRDLTADLLLRRNALAVTREYLEAIQRNYLVMDLSYIIIEERSRKNALKAILKGPLWVEQHTETQDLQNITQDQLWELKIDQFLNHFGLQREDVPEGLRSIRLEELEQILPLMDHQPEKKDEMLEELDEIIVRLGAEGYPELAKILSHNNPGEWLG